MVKFLSFEVWTVILSWEDEDSICPGVWREGFNVWRTSLELSMRNHSRRLIDWGSQRRQETQQAYLLHRWLHHWLMLSSPYCTFWKTEIFYDTADACLWRGKRITATSSINYSQHSKIPLTLTSNNLIGNRSTHDTWFRILYAS